MALSTLHTPTEVDPALLEEAYELVARPMAPEAVLERARRWSALLAEHPPPDCAGATTRKVWAALLDAGRPVRTQELALLLQRHRGNIDRSLMVLRDAGLVERTAYCLHQAIPENCRH